MSRTRIQFILLVLMGMVTTAGAVERPTPPEKSVLLTEDSAPGGPATSVSDQPVVRHSVGTKETSYLQWGAAGGASLQWLPGSNPAAVGSTGPSGQAQYGSLGLEPIGNTTEFPGSAIAKLYMEFPIGGSYVCSGSFIGPDLIATAAHCVWDPAFGFADSIEVVPGKDGPSEPFGSVFAVEYYLSPGYMPEGDFEHDFAVIRVDAPLGDTTGWFSVYSPPSELLWASAVTTAGYPGAALNTEVSYQESGPFERIWYFQQAYLMDSFGGMSGGPVWMNHPLTGESTLIGVHAWEWPYKGYNGGTRFQPDKMAVILESMAESIDCEGLSCFDCTPNCADLSCGDNGCGGSCGDCAAGSPCTDNGVCLPADWTCEPTSFGGLDGCDCECGAYDPDCDDPKAVPKNCQPGQTCSAAAVCEGAPNAWICAVATYGADDGCDCECGAYDPDCDNPYTTMFNCGFGQTCSVDGTCDGEELDWFCDPSYYAGSDGCDCGCGSYDPDCDDPGAFVYGCNGGTCNSDGTCDDPAAPEVPAGWVCSPAYYAAFDGCDCNCGAYDPDCDDPGTFVYGCGGAMCNSDGTCDEPEVPEGWFCSAFSYGSGGACDCDCGIYDPDCDDSFAPVNNCGFLQGCSSEGLCEGEASGWTCPTSWFGSLDGCDCNCGDYDPDCDDPTQPVLNCASGICSAEGECFYPEVPDEWTCDPADYSANDGCHCGCGIADPDCETNFGSPIGCELGQTCGEHGACEGEAIEWNCPIDFYGTNDGCDCNCGSYDPDCDFAGSSLYNCDVGQTCSDEGLCVTDCSVPGACEWQCIPTGDPNYSGATDISDVQCVIVTALWSIQIVAGNDAVSTEPPTCTGGDLTQADLDCNGEVNVADVGLTVGRALELPLPAEFDVDGDGCVDACLVFAD